MQRVDEFLQARPNLEAALTDAGIRNHPDIIRRLAENAFSLKQPRK